MNAAAPSVVFLGIDSAEPALLRRWMASGDLPVLSELSRRSTWGATTTPIGFGNGVLWPSIFTGVNPARHGRMWFQQMLPGTYKILAFRDDGDFGAPPLWEAYSEAGKRCAIVDVVRAPLSVRLNGIQICDWFTHDRNSPPRSHPSSLINEVTTEFGDDPFGGRCEAPGSSPEACKRLTGGLVARVRSKTAFVRKLLKERRWDYLMAVFAEPHDIGHLCWHLHDPADSKHDPALRAAVGDPIKDVYVAIDEAIGELLQHIDASTSVVVFSGPGMQTFASASHLLDRILARLEGNPAGRRALIRHRLRSLYIDSVPNAVRERMKALSGGIGAAMRESEAGRRRFFAMPNNDEYGSIRINLIGREPHGMVRPGAEYDQVCARLEHDLSSITDVETGRPIVGRVVRVRDHYQGEYLDRLPDLIVIWDLQGPVEAVRSPQIGEIRGRHPTTRTGDHSDRCLFFAAGPDIPAAEVKQPIDYLDLAATIPALLGVRVPGLDGHASDQILPRTARQRPLAVSG